MKTYAPSSTNRLALASAMPLDPPVMTATLPSSLPMTFSFSRVGQRLCFGAAPDGDEDGNVLGGEEAGRGAYRPRAYDGVIMSISISTVAGNRPPSDVADAAVDNHVGARHERALVRREEERGIGEFLGPSQSQHGCVVGVSLADRGSLFGRRRLGIEHRRVNDARA